MAARGSKEEDLDVVMGEGEVRGSLSGAADGGSSQEAETIHVRTSGEAEEVREGRIDPFALQAEMKEDLSADR